jgi:predicted RNA-binding protein associated with RNAse of E/G family
VCSSDLFPNGDSYIIDEDQLRRRVEEGIFPEKVATLAMSEADLVKTYDESEIL